MRVITYNSYNNIVTNKAISLAVAKKGGGVKREKLPPNQTTSPPGYLMVRISTFHV